MISQDYETWHKNVKGDYGLSLMTMKENKCEVKYDDFISEVHGLSSAFILITFLHSWVIDHVR